MLTYATTHSSFWTGSTGRAIRGDPWAQAIAHYLYTAPRRNPLGLYYLTLADISHETGHSPDHVNRVIQLLTDLHFLRYDPTSEFVWIFEMARFQFHLPRNAKSNQVKHARNIYYEQVEDNPFLFCFYARYKDDLHLSSPRHYSGKLHHPPKPSKSLLPRTHSQRVPNAFPTRSEPIATRSRSCMQYKDLDLDLDLGLDLRTEDPNLSQTDFRYFKQDCIRPEKTEKVKNAEPGLETPSAKYSKQELLVLFQETFNRLVISPADTHTLGKLTTQYSKAQLWDAFHQAKVAKAKRLPYVLKILKSKPPPDATPETDPRLQLILGSKS